MKEIPIFEEVLQRVVKQPGFWMKMLIGGLLSFIPVVNFLAFGFLQRLATNVQNNGSTQLPEWADWKNLFYDGIRMGIVWLAFWLLPMLLAILIGSLLGAIGLAALGYLLVSLVFVILPMVFGAAVYRYNSRSDFKDLMDLPLIIKMAHLTFPKMVVPSFFFLGVFALNPALYGFTMFFGFTLIVLQVSLVYTSIEKSGLAAN